MEKFPNNLTFVRHGENVVDGRVDNNELPLSKAGVEQARWAAQTCARHFQKPDVLFTSPAERTIQTACLIDPDVKPVEDSRLLERGWDGDNNDGSETNEEAIERVGVFLDEAAKRYKEKNVLVVSHGGLIKIAENLIERRELADHKIENGAIVHYSVAEDGSGENAGYLRFKNTARPFDDELKREIIKKGINAYFVRHGESESNRDGVLAGRMDSPLTDTGIEQARTLALKLAELDIKFDKIFSSPLARSLDTAKIIAKECGISEEKIVILGELTGCGGGDLESKPYSEWYAVPTERLVSEHGAESYETQRRRISKTMLHIVRNTEFGERLLIVSHSSVFQVFQALNSGINDEEKTFRQDKPAPGDYKKMEL